MRLISCKACISVRFVGKESATEFASWGMSRDCVYKMTIESGVPHDLHEIFVFAFPCVGQNDFLFVLKPKRLAFRKGSPNSMPFMDDGGFVVTYA